MKLLNSERGFFERTFLDDATDHNLHGPLLYLRNNLMPCGRCKAGRELLGEIRYRVAAPVNEVAHHLNRAFGAWNIRMDNKRALMSCRRIVELDGRGLHGLCQ